MVKIFFMMIKRFFYIFSVLILTHGLTGCSTNPATGKNQFTALMSPSQELQIGAKEHSKIIKQYGIYDDKKLGEYMSRVGAKVVKYTERPEVEYKFYLLDSPMINAFALPGGYIYMTRGLLSLANSEAEMAGVLAHETGHITARHSAERYSRGMVTSLGAMVLSAAVGSSGVSQALGIGSDLFMKSYSRGQEMQADSLGIRYLVRSGYNPKAMAGFLRNLQADSALQDMVDKKKSSKGGGYFATHPATQDRVNKTISEAQQYAGQGANNKWIDNRSSYLRMLDGVIYGDSAEQGFARGRNFYHPNMGFKFSVPENYKIINQPSQVIAAAKNGAVIIFDIALNKNALSPMSFIKDVWMHGEPVTGAENIRVNGMSAATASFNGNINGRPMQVQLVAIKWSDNKVVRFQVAIPNGLSSAQLNDLKRSTYSFSRMSEKEKRDMRPYRIKIIVSKAGDSVAKLARRMAQSDHKEQRFRVLNGLSPSDKIIPNRLYKIVVD